MKTLYVSDLDGTLLRREQQLSDFTVNTINTLVERGMLFSYATARSIVTATKVTPGLSTHIPVIVHNGTFIRRADTGTLLASHFFGKDAEVILNDLMAHDIYPIVYTLIDGQEKFRYWEEKMTPAMREFVGTRQNDPREKPVHCAADLYAGQPYYITCIDDREKLIPFLDKYAERFHTILYREIYSGHNFLEFMPKAASKANAALELKALLGCDKLVAFGDGLNDLDLFRAADEAYAVENAVPELKAIATGIIGSNQNDGVARWLLENADRQGLAAFDLI